MNNKQYIKPVITVSLYECEGYLLAFSTTVINSGGGEGSQTGSGEGIGLGDGSITDGGDVGAKLGFYANDIDLGIDDTSPF